MSLISVFDVIGPNMVGEFGMQNRKLLEKIDFEKGVFVYEGKEYPLRDTNFPTCLLYTSGFHFYTIRVVLKIRFTRHGMYHIPLSGFLFQDAGMRISTFPVGSQHYSTGNPCSSSESDIPIPE